MTQRKYAIELSIMATFASPSFGYFTDNLANYWHYIVMLTIPPLVKSNNAVKRISLDMINIILSLDLIGSILLQQKVDLIILISLIVVYRYVRCGLASLQHLPHDDNFWDFQLLSALIMNQQQRSNNLPQRTIIELAKTNLFIIVWMVIIAVSRIFDLLFYFEQQLPFVGKWYSDGTFPIVCVSLLAFSDVVLSNTSSTQ